MRKDKGERENRSETTEHHVGVLGCLYGLLLIRTTDHVVANPNIALLRQAKKAIRKRKLFTVLIFEHVHLEVYVKSGMLWSKREQIKDTCLVELLTTSTLPQPLIDISKKNPLPQSAKQEMEASGASDRE